MNVKYHGVSSINHGKLKPALSLQCNVLALGVPFLKKNAGQLADGKLL